LSFIGVAALIIVIPGADMMLVTNNTMSRGRAAGFRTVAGAGLGLAVHASAAIAGLSALIATSATAFSIVKILGALFLIFIGLSTLWSTIGSTQGTPPTIRDRTPTDPPQTDKPGNEAKGTNRDPLLQGFLTNVLNPKLAIFFVSFLPQFISNQAATTPQIIILSAVFIAMGAVWLSFYVMAVDSLSGYLQRPSVEVWIRRIVGTALGGLGLRLALATQD
jgi:threonine/homoserine/homoserine lactone efflux protein